MKSIIVLTLSLLGSWFCALVGRAIQDYVTPLAHYLMAFSAAVFYVVFLSKRRKLGE
jgi:hypothetical protein